MFSSRIVYKLLAEVNGMISVLEAGIQTDVIIESEFIVDNFKLGVVDLNEGEYCITELHTNPNHQRLSIGKFVTKGGNRHAWQDFGCPSTIKYPGVSASKKGNACDIEWEVKIPESLITLTLGCGLARVSLEEEKTLVEVIL